MVAGGACPSHDQQWKSMSAGSPGRQWLAHTQPEAKLFAGPCDVVDACQALMHAGHELS